MLVLTKLSTKKMRLGWTNMGEHSKGSQGLWSGSPFTDFVFCLICVVLRPLFMIERICRSSPLGRGKEAVSLDGDKMHKEVALIWNAASTVGHVFTITGRDPVMSNLLYYLHQVLWSIVPPFVTLWGTETDRFVYSWLRTAFPARSRGIRSPKFT